MILQNKSKVRKKMSKQQPVISSFIGAHVIYIYIYIYEDFIVKQTLKYIFAAG